MKERFSLAVNCVASFLLSVCVLWCLTSSFEINVNIGTVIISVLIFSGVFSLLSVFAKSKMQFWISISVILIVFIFTVLFSMDVILAQTNYFVNCILNHYSKSFSISQAVWFTSTVVKNADVVFIILGFILCAVNTLSLVRAKRLIPSTVICVLFLVPCFVLVSNPPMIIPIITVITILISLYVTAFFRKINFKQHGFVLLAVTSVVLIFSIIIYSLIPIENYNRFEWQDKLLDFSEMFIGIRGKTTSDFDIIKHSISQTKNLAEIRPLEQKGINELEVKAPIGGKVYLKGISYANYSENEWSILTDEQAERYPDDINAFTMTKGVEYYNFDIITQIRSDVVYTPYYPLSLSDDFTPVYDMLIANNSGTKSYSFKCYSNEDNYLVEKDEYTQYVYETYTSLPDSTKEKMLEIAKENGLDQIPTYYTPYVVKDFISEKGYYSLDTEQMPDGEDFPVWFLNEAESGYCVHYATSATVMLRALGIPARYVTGYYVNAKEGEWTTVTSDNAHAWVEYYDPEIGWAVLEATPSSFEPTDYFAVDVETVPTTAITPEQDSTQAVTEPSTKTTDNSISNNGGVDTPSKTEIKLDGLFILIAVFALILIILGSVLIRYALIIWLRKKRFSNGKRNTQVLHIYRYIEKIKSISHNVIPDRINEIALKAKFSNHRISKEEVGILLNFMNEARVEFYRNSSKLKKLYYRFIKVI